MNFSESIYKESAHIFYQHIFALSNSFFVFPLLFLFDSLIGNVTAKISYLIGYIIFTLLYYIIGYFIFPIQNGLNAINPNYNQYANMLPFHTIILGSYNMFIFGYLIAFWFNLHYLYENESDNVYNNNLYFIYQATLCLFVIGFYSFILDMSVSTVCISFVLGALLGILWSMLSIRDTKLIEKKLENE